MTCKYLTQKTIHVAEIGSAVPSTMTQPVCALGRNPEGIGWSLKCESTMPEDPCWLWIEQCGTDVPDSAFKRQQG